MNKRIQTMEREFLQEKVKNLETIQELERENQGLAI
jgi:hypothetical protein